MSLKRFIGKAALKLKGWKHVGTLPTEAKKCVCIYAPHTSMEDFFIGLYFYWAEEIPFKVMIKKEFFKTPIIRWCLLRLGGIPVDRGHQNHLVEKMVEMFEKEDTVCLTICPEATRKKVDRWKKGFYYIAEGAKVPIMIGFCDFQKKICGFGPMILPTGDYDKDLSLIWDFYKDVKAKFPDKFNLDEQYRTQESGN
ncbi:MAG: 1-acyl-sn-glycerol-3-phosphate acyltransferase [Candidatus Limimorpha sp.]